MPEEVQKNQTQEKIAIQPLAFYSRAEVADALGVSLITVDRALAARRLRAARVGRRVIVRGSEIVRFAEGGYERG